MAAMMTAAADDQHWRDKEHGQVDRRWAAEQVAAATGTGERELRREGIASSREQQQEIPLHRMITAAVTAATTSTVLSTRYTVEPRGV